jgi:hypothetical protein
VGLVHENQDALRLPCGHLGRRTGIAGFAVTLALAPTSAGAQQIFATFQVTKLSGVRRATPGATILTAPLLALTHAHKGRPAQPDPPVR